MDTIRGWKDEKEGVEEVGKAVEVEVGLGLGKEKQRGVLEVVLQFQYVLSCSSSSFPSPRLLLLPAGVPPCPISRSSFFFFSRHATSFLFISDHANENRH